MFSLIITTISIALVAVLAAAAIYYGGSVSARTSARTAAAALINQGSQINAAGALAMSQGSAWPAGAPGFAPPFLAAMPVPPQAAYALSSDVASASHWSYYIPPTPEMPIHHFVLKNKISAEVCMAVNKEQGLIGIPAVWDGKTLIQCFGPGVTAQSGGPLAYTFLYDPVGSNPAQDAAALALSKAEGGSAIAGYPRLCPDDTVIPSGLCVNPNGTAPASGGGVVVAPEYPKTCPDGSVINAGTCPVTPVGPVAGYSAKLNIFPSVLGTDGNSLYGDGMVHYCTGFSMASAPDWSTTVSVDGVFLSIWDAYVAGDQLCVSVNGGHPARPAGTYVVTLRTGGGSDHGGSTVGGTITYANSVGPAPVLQSLTPNKGSLDGSTTVTIYGSGFSLKSAVVVSSVKMSTSFIDSNTLQVDMPSGYSFGYPGGLFLVAVVVQNPDGAIANSALYFEFGEAGMIGGGGLGGGGGGETGGGGGPPPAD